MLTLLKSQRFQEDFNRYKDKISAITDEKLKQELTLNLTKLVTEVRNLDIQHQDIFSSRGASLPIDNTKQKIIEIRKFLDKKLKDWDDFQSQK